MGPLEDISDGKDAKGIYSWQRQDSMVVAHIIKSMKKKSKSSFDLFFHIKEIFLQKVRHGSHLMILVSILSTCMKLMFLLQCCCNASFQPQ